MKKCVAVTFCLLSGVIQSTVALADELSYDTGTLGSSFSASWGKYFAVRFTNTNTCDVTLAAVWIRGHSSIQGSLDVYVWANNGGQPGQVLAKLSSQYLSSSYSNMYDVSGSNIVLHTNTDVFAGFDPGTCSVPYDTASGEGQRNWWMQSTTWTQGGPQSVTKNLMVRLEVTPVPPPVPIQLTSIALSDGLVTVAVTNLTIGLTNFLERNEDLLSNVWQEVTSFVSSAEGAETNLSDVSSNEWNRMFYRVRTIY